MDLLYLLALLACPVGMGAMMWFMMRGKGHTHTDESAKTEQHPEDVEIAKLRAEVAELRTARRDFSDRGGRPGERA